MPKVKEEIPMKEAVPLEPEDLQQGKLYLLKINSVKLALFEGWNDDMCCFNLLREDAVPMRWSEARYLPGDFSAFDAFDSTGNPSIEMWRKSLRYPVPQNWFGMFEEARRKQRVWANGGDDDALPVVGSEHDVPYTIPPLPPTPPPTTSPQVSQVPQAPQDPQRKNSKWFGSSRRRKTKN
ncbi:hypothetical protein BC938DRAFT_479190 [Jimgerdemannia flammicorona]|uniref:Uncharacterized protein n=1 Tax=Jimgerdemannia flammicorona TaxID=994334 RepID=A0A433QXZ0_9FUNG|nr:hypothetical protein BC938DRAFT_479190 [Jimgerdemannia flammicorona]